MSIENPGNSDPSLFMHRSVDDQKRDLESLLAANTQRIKGDPDFYFRLKQRFTEIHPTMAKMYNPDEATIVVSRVPYSKGTNLTLGSQPESETLEVGFTYHHSGGEVTYYVPVAERTNTTSGSKLEVESAFTDEQAKMVENMVDGFLAAIATGQLQDLDKSYLGSIIDPGPHPEST